MKTAAQRNMDEHITTFAEMVRASAFGMRHRAASTYANQASGPEGGYAVPTAYVENIYYRGENSLLPLCDVVPVSSSDIKIPTDGTAPWDASAIQAVWSDEGAALPEGIPHLSLQGFALRKLTCFIPVTDELFEDSAALQAYLPDAMRRAVTWKVNDSIINGIGAARPLGILNADATITANKETSQTAATIVEANISNMMSRCLDVFGAHWIANPDALGQIVALPQWDAATRTLGGLPVVLTEACQALGTRGDLILANMGGYRFTARGDRLAVSSHIYFDRDLTAYRLVSRIDGAPILRAPTTPPNSSNSRSHFVVLATRS